MRHKRQNRGSEVKEQRCELFINSSLTLPGRNVTEYFSEFSRIFLFEN